jgi:hypothetical protein
MSHTGSPMSGLRLRDAPLGLPDIASPTVLSGIRQRWTLDDVPWDEIDPRAVAHREPLFFIVVSASFIESATGVYTRNLMDFFAGDAQATAWLEQRWEPEELQHGRALRRYTELAWPDFDWPGTYRGFLAEFSLKSDADGLEPSRALEAASRCMVEMGTASYYSALGRLSPEPVLGTLAQLIREDEVRHYKYFHRYFQSYRERERCSRLAILGAMWRRLRMMDMGDSYIALKHVCLARHPGAVFDRKRYRRIQTRLRRLMGPHVPLEMSARMSLRLLDLPHGVQDAVLPLVMSLSRHLAGVTPGAG